MSAKKLVIFTPGLRIWNLPSSNQSLMKSRIMCQVLLAMPYKISFLNSLLMHSKNVSLPSLKIPYNTAESERFVTLQKVLTKVLNSEMGQSVTSKVHYGMQEVRDDMNSQSKYLGKYCLDVQSANSS
ncbi:hypothetical protein Tco_1379525, partial [Tanacetum coccineum]